ncbi:MAG: hypothetical protein HY898_26330 [Deltaproteobacteria bacterium]|nr:hypothetical protein [Deltaproteobacteria bacterium]
MRPGLLGFAAASIALSVLQPAAAAPSKGVSFDYAQGKEDAVATLRAWKGRAYLHPAVLAEPTRPRPLVVFMHGLNRDKVPFRWMGAASDPDVRDMIAGLIDGQKIEPAILVAPTTVTECDTPRTMWPGFDLGRFLALTMRHLDARVVVDRRNVILVGHSGAACNTAGGLVAAVRSEAALKAVLVIDTCMDEAAGGLLALAPPDTDVVVSWQPLGWERPFEAFERLFLESSGDRHSRGLRKVQRLNIPEPNAHGAIVPVALEHWLPHWIPGPLARRP